MSYGILLWGIAADINTIFGLQKRAMRAIYSMGPTDYLLVSYLIATMGILFILPSSTQKLFSSENTTLNRIMTETELSLMGSISSASTVLVIPFCGYLIDTLGRKGALILFYLPLVLGWGLIVTIYRIEAFLCSMFLCGLSVTMFLIIPVYVSEYCDPCIRGAMASCGTTFYGVGVMISYLLGGILDYNTMNYTGLAMTLVGLVLICFLKESPLYLMKKGYEEEPTALLESVQSQEAAKSIAFYKGVKCNSKEVIKQMENIRRLLSADIGKESTPQEEKLNPDEYKPREKLPIWKFLAKSQSTRRALVRVLILMTSSLFQGLIVVQVYAKPLFEEAVPNISSTLSSVMFGIITIAANLFGAYLIDTAGRRRLLIVSSFATGLLCVTLATQIQFNWGPNWLSAVLLYSYSFTYSVGPGIVPVVLIGEVFLPEIKGFTAMLCTEWGFMCVFIVIFIFNPLFNAYGLGPLFYLFAGSSFFTVFFSFIYLPETKGLPVDVIQQKFMQIK